jgi:hypothetical protein
MAISAADASTLAARHSRSANLPVALAVSPCISSIHFGRGCKAAMAAMPRRRPADVVQLESPSVRHTAFDEACGVERVAHRARQGTKTGLVQEQLSTWTRPVLVIAQFLAGREWPNMGSTKRPPSPSSSRASGCPPWPATYLSTASTTLTWRRAAGCSPRAASHKNRPCPRAAVRSSAPIPRHTCRGQVCRGPGWTSACAT